MVSNFLGNYYYYHHHHCCYYYTYYYLRSYCYVYWKRIQLSMFICFELFLPHFPSFLFLPYWKMWVLIIQYMPWQGSSRRQWRQFCCAGLLRYFSVCPKIRGCSERKQICLRRLHFISVEGVKECTYVLERSLTAVCQAWRVTALFCGCKQTKSTQCLQCIRHYCI